MRQSWVHMVNGKQFYCLPNLIVVVLCAVVWTMAHTQTRPDIVWMAGGHLSSFRMAVSPDGLFIATWAGDKTLKLWRQSDGVLLRTFFDPSGISSATFSRDSRLLAVPFSSEFVIRLIRPTSGQIIRTISGYRGFISSLEFSPDAAYLAGCTSEGTVWLWRVADGALIASQRIQTVFPETVAFSPDGTFIVTGDQNGVLRFWDVPTLQETRNIAAHRGQILAIAFSPDGQLLASSDTDATICLWRVLDGHTVWTRHLELDDANAVAFSRDGTQLVTGHDYRTRYWRVSDGTLVQTLDYGAHSIASLPDGQSLVSGDESSIYWWRIGEEHPYRQQRVVVGEAAAAAYSPDGTLVASCHGDGYVRLWNAATGELIRTLYGDWEEVNCLAFSPDGQFLAAGSQGFPTAPVRIWRVADGTLVRLLTIPAGNVHSVAFSPSGTYLAVGDDEGTVHVFRTADGTSLYTRYVGQATIYAIAYSYDEEYLLTGEYGYLYILRADNGSLVQRVSAHNHFIFALAFSPDGQTLASGSRDKSIRLRRYGTWEETRRLTGHTGTVVSVAFAPNGRYLLSGGGMGDRTLRLWRVSTGAQLRNYTQEIGYGIESVEFSPLGDTFVYARADGVVVVARNPLYVPPIEGDVNRDDCVDDLDLLRVLFAFGRTDTGLREDVNRDGVVDDGDLLLVLSNFGQGCE